VFARKSRTEPQGVGLEPLCDKLRELTGCHGLFEDIVAYLKALKRISCNGENPHTKRRDEPKKKSFVFTPSSRPKFRWMSSFPFWGRLVLSL
jgi:hypothetical protein